MKISFKKLEGKHDEMTIMHCGRKSVVILCPKQGIIPHEMVHFAVESTLRRRGFLTRVCEGEAAEFRMSLEPESDGIERLVEVFQGDAWSSGDSSPDELIDLYRVTCHARDCAPLPVGPSDVAAVRDCINALDRRWNELAPWQSIELEL